MKNRKLRARDNQAYIYLIPWIIGMLLLQVYPFVTSLYYSLTDYNALQGAKFTGLSNYIKLFTRDKEFVKSLTATIK